MTRDIIKKSRTLFRRAAAAREGSTAVETAIVMPVLLLMIVGTCYAGFLLYTTNMLYYAVEQAARCAAINATVCGTTTATQNFAVTQAMGVSIPAANFQVTKPVNGCGWQVRTVYTFTFLMPFQTNFNLNLTANACFPAST
jgi:Flp pilus assembly protein TadG